MPYVAFFTQRGLERKIARSGFDILERENLYPNPPNLFVPNLPPDWPGYEAKWKLSKGTLTIAVRRTGTYAAVLDGKAVKEGVPLAAIT